MADGWLGTSFMPDHARIFFDHIAAGAARVGRTPAETAIEVQRLWLDGKRDEAAARVPDELVLKTNLLGTERMVRERILKYRDAGVTTLRVEPAADDLATRVATLGRLMDLVRAI
jgi:alkanesulfonate monooxygenase SsuD/methylene tetrahydromethanopterin reductase-like flavin-dependent oxidoreductase (luciferase family)